MDPLISIVIPTYNSKNYLTILLKSINSNLSNSNDIRKNFEIIVIDDGSNQNLYSLRNLIPFRYFKQKNTGAASARNFGSKVSKGKYLFFLDSDLKLPNNFLNKVFHILSKKKINVLSFYYNNLSYKKNDNYIPKLKAHLDWFMNKQKKNLYLDTLIHGQCVVFDKNFFFRSKGWDTKLLGSICENEEFSKRVLKKTRIYTNFEIGPYHYYKKIYITTRDVFLRSYIWSKLFFEKKVNRDYRFKFINIFFFSFPLISILTLLVDYKISLILLTFFYLNNFNLYKHVFKNSSLALSLLSIFFYPLIFTVAIIGSISGSIFNILNKFKIY